MERHTKAVTCTTYKECISIRPNLVCATLLSMTQGSRKEGLHHKTPRQSHASIGYVDPETTCIDGIPKER